MRKVIRSIYLFAACGVLSVGVAATAQIAPASAAAIHTRHHVSDARAARAPARPIPPGITLRPVRNAPHGRPDITIPRNQRSARTSGTGNLLYHGGAVQNAPTVYLLFWGSWWNSTCSNSGGNGGGDEGYPYDDFHTGGGPDDGVAPSISQHRAAFGAAPQWPRQM